MENNDVLEQEIIKRIEDMEKPDYEFPLRFSKKDYIVTAVVVVLCFALIIFGAHL